MTPAERALYDDHLPLALKIANSWRIPPWVPRDDLHSAARIGLWQAATRHRGDTDSFGSYASSRVRGAIKDELRRFGGFRTRRDMEAAPRLMLPLEKLQDQLAAAATLDDAYAALCSLARAIHALPEREQIVITEHYFRGTRFKQLAKQLGVSDPRVSQLHAQGMKRLRAHLATW